MLWLWILGLADHFIQGHVDLKEYERQAEKLYQEVSRLNLHFSRNKEFHLKLSRKATEGMDVVTERDPIGCISSRTVVNLFMLRSWSLFEAMKYSETIIPKVGRRPA